tara:strand:- start:193 stop:399 length:207 start_codon:yes stop_codon:yes gene_type:complete
MRRNLMDVSKLNEKLRNIKKEIQEIQDSCMHKNKQIKMDEKGQPMWTCNDCEKQLTFPSENELNEFFK